MNLSREDLLLLYRNMVRGRKHDEAIVEMCQKSQMLGMWHSGIGHEAIGAGIATFLRKDDWLGITHRGITAGLAKGPHSPSVRSRRRRKPASPYTAGRHTEEKR